MNNDLVSGVSALQYQTHAGNLQTPFRAGREILTQFPKNVAIIGSVTTVALTALLVFQLSVLSATVFYWPVTIVGLASAGWTIYSSLLSKDLLMEAFYKIVGGKENFEALPQIDLAQKTNEKIYEAIERIRWENLKQPITRARTLDGRNIVIVKRHQHSSLYEENSIIAFVEKAYLRDFPIVVTDLEKSLQKSGISTDFPFIPEKYVVELAQILMSSIDLFHGNKLNRTLYHNKVGNKVQACEMYSFISSDMANELFSLIRQK